MAQPAVSLKATSDAIATKQPLITASTDVVAKSFTGTGSGLTGVQLASTAQVTGLDATLAGKQALLTSTSDIAIHSVSLTANAAVNRILQCTNATTGAGVWMDSSAVVTATPNRVIISDSTGALVGGTTTSAEIGYVSGVTSSVQTQITARALQSDLVALTSRVAALEVTIANLLPLSGGTLTGPLIVRSTIDATQDITAYSTV